MKKNLTAMTYQASLCLKYLSTDVIEPREEKCSGDGAENYSLVRRTARVIYGLSTGVARARAIIG